MGSSPSRGLTAVSTMFFSDRIAWRPGQGGCCWKWLLHPIRAVAIGNGFTHRVTAHPDPKLRLQLQQRRRPGLLHRKRRRRGASSRWLRPRPRAACQRCVGFCPLRLAVVAGRRS